MITVSDNSVQSINAALLQLQNSNSSSSSESTSSGNTVTVIEKTTVSGSDNSALIMQLQSQIKALSDKVTAMKSENETLDENVDVLTQKLELIAPYSDTTYIQSIQSAKEEAIASASAGGNIYIGPFATAPDVSSYVEGNYYLNTADGLTYTLTSGVWVADTGAKLTEHQASCITDLLAIADSLSDSPTFIKNLVAANVFVNNLFTKKIVITDGGSIQSSNFEDSDGNETGEGFKLDTDGNIYANNGYFRGRLGVLKQLEFPNEDTSIGRKSMTYEITESRTLHWELFLKASFTKWEYYYPIGTLDIVENIDPWGKKVAMASGKIFNTTLEDYLRISMVEDTENDITTFSLDTPTERNIYVVETKGA